jgi:1,4-alpha-glucan branching enzyme
MLANEKFKAGFLDYCDTKIVGAQSDYQEFTSLGHQKIQIDLAKFWEDHYSQIKDTFIHRYNRDLIAGFKEMLEKDYMDIITCGATHGYSPLLSVESSINGQFKTAVNNYRKHFGKAPMGTWLPECAYRPGYKWKRPVGDPTEYYRPGVEKFLSKNNLKYFFIDTPLLLGGKSQGVYAARFPLLNALWEQFAAQYKESKGEFVRNAMESYLVATNDAKNPVAFFTRDENTGILVWSGEHGYPGCGCYLDFHKKHYKDSMGGGSGLRYWKVTSAKTDLGSKMLYYLPDIGSQLDENAGHFKEAVKGVLRKNQSSSPTDRPPLLIAPYDAELFGHWWFEGVWFINRVIRFFAQDSEVQMTHCRNYLETYGMPNKTVQLTEGSWGQGSGHYIWLNKENSWTWEKIYQVEPKIETLITQNYNNQDSLLQRLLKQLVRENLLLQSSDWQFLISTWSARDYAENRFSQHYEHITRLFGMIDSYLINKSLILEERGFLEKLEQVDDLFSELDLSAWIKDQWQE